MPSKAINPHPQRAADLVRGQSELARLLSTDSETLTPQAVGAWCRSGRVPPGRVLDIERVTNGQVTRHQLRPDIYPLDAPNYAIAG